MHNQKEKNWAQRPCLHSPVWSGTRTFIYIKKKLWLWNVDYMSFKKKKKKLSYIDTEALEYSGSDHVFCFVLFSCSRFCIGRNLVFRCVDAALIFQKMHVDALLTSRETGEKKYIQQSDVIYNDGQKWQ